MLEKLKNSLEYHGFWGLVKFTLKSRIPRTEKGRWKGGIQNEINFWDGFFTSDEWKEKSHTRLNPKMELQSDVAKFLPADCNNPRILDVGAGPLTYLGTMYNGKKLDLIPIDPLADEYGKILSKHSIKPVVCTKKMSAEKISQNFEENSFDLVFARNCIDHSVSPENSILEMIKVVKKGSYIYMIHRPNEATNENYRGFHQWNFSNNGNEFLIGSKKNEVNFSKKYEHLIESKAILDEVNNWLITEFRKK